MITRTVGRKRKVIQDRFTPRTAIVNGHLAWQIHLPSRMVTDPAGAAHRYRPRETFRDQQKAELRAEQLRIERRNHGNAGLAMSLKIRSDALHALEILEPFGASIVDAAQFYARHVQARANSRPLAEAFDKFLADQRAKRCSAVYLKDARLRLGKFVTEHEGQSIGEIGIEEISGWLSSLQCAPATRNAFRRRLSALFAYCVNLGWLEQNPVTKVGVVKEDESPIGILSPEEFARLLENSNVETRPYWIFGGFCGLRTAELERLEWDNVHFADCLVEVPAHKSKSARRRFVKIRPAAMKWLEPYIFRTEGPTVPETARRQRLEADRAAAALTKWPNNALRHSFASMHLAAFENAAELALEMGHTNANLIFARYRQLVKPALAKRWWETFPTCSAHKIVEITAS